VLFRSASSRALLSQSQAARLFASNRLLEGEGEPSLSPEDWPGWLTPDCQTVCNITFPGTYLQVRAGIHLAKQAGLIRSRGQCNNLASHAGTLIALLTPLDPLAAAAVAIVSEECIKCACRKIF